MKYLVYGLGKSGIESANLLRRQGEEFILFDENESFDIEGFKRKNPEFKDTYIITGNLNKETIDSLDTVVISPGVPLDHDNVVRIQSRNVKIIGEIELGYSYEKGRMVAITGTNGKTTTTSLVGHIFATAGYKTFVAGNIGDPYTAVCDKTTSDSVTVLEVSSFQLETVREFAPSACAVLNITPDHLDRHKTFHNYAEIKKSVADNLKDGGRVVLNIDDPILKEFGESTKHKVSFFSSKEELFDGYYYSEGYLYKGQVPFFDVKDLNILGVHNYENVLAAVALADSLGCDYEAIVKALKTFKAVEHRIEFVTEKNGVRYYNDSKGTNTDASIKAVLAMERPIVLIAGGYDKKADYTDFIKTFKGRVRHMVLLGQTARDIANCAEKNGFSDYSFYDTFDSAVKACMDIARPGECVLLSPACASWGMFKNYEERGKLFKEIVLQGV